MILSKPLVTNTFNQEDTTLAKYRLAKLGTAAEDVVAAVSTNALIIGITDESADSTADNPVGVVMAGIGKLVMLNTSTKGGAVTGTTAGKGVVTTTQNQYCVGWLLETTTVANQVAAVLVNPFLYPTVS